MVIVTDNGTTNTKAFVFDPGAGIISGASEPTPTSCPGPGQVEQEAGRWWSATVAAVGKLRREGARSKCEALCSSAQGGSFVPLSAALEPLRPGITWLDSRGKGCARALNASRGKDFFYRRTGHHLAGWAPPAVLRWMARHEPGKRSALARLSFVSDYLNYRLTGRFFIDHTAAAMTMLYDPVAGGWDAEILEISGLKASQLPEIVPAGRVGGRLTREASRRLGLPSGLPVVSGGHDQYCASLGAGASRPGDCLVSCGTAWVLLACLDRPLFMPAGGWAPGRHLEDGKWGLMAALGEGGALLDWVRRNFRVPDGAALEGNEPEKVYFRPGLNRGRAAIGNLSFDTGGAAVYRAALRALALSLRGRLDLLPAGCGVKKLFLVGGGRREAGLERLLAELTGREVLVPPIEEAAARGAALLALGAAGNLPDPSFSL